MKLNNNQYQIPRGIDDVPTVDKPCVIDATEEDDSEGDSQQVVNDMATRILPQSDHVAETDEVETQHQGAETVAGDIGSQSEFDTLNLTICQHPMSLDQEGTQQGTDKSQIDMDAISATEYIRGCMLSKKRGLCDNVLYVLGTVKVVCPFSCGVRSCYLEINKIM